MVRTMVRTASRMAKRRLGLAVVVALVAGLDCVGCFAAVLPFRVAVAPWRRRWRRRRLGERDCGSRLWKIAVTVGFRHVSAFPRCLPHVPQRNRGTHGGMRMRS